MAQPAPARPVALAAEPKALTTLAAESGDTGALAKRVVAKLEWPNKPAPVVAVAPLTAEEQKQFAAGAEIYKNVCVGLPSARRPRQGEDGATARRVAVHDRTRRRRCRRESCSPARKARSA